MKKLFILLALSLLLTSCVSTVIIEEEKGEIKETVTEPEISEETPNDEEIVEETPDEAKEKEEDANPSDDEKEKDTTPDDEKSDRPDGAPTPEENELVALPFDFEDVSEDELLDILNGALGDISVEFPTIPIE